MCISHLIEVSKDDTTTYVKPVVHTSLFCCIPYTAYVLIWKAADDDINLARMSVDLWLLSCHIAVLVMLGRLRCLAKPAFMAQKLSTLVAAFGMCVIASHVGNQQAANVTMLSGSLICSVAMVRDHVVRSARVTTLQGAAILCLYVPAFIIAALEPDVSVYAITWLSMLLKYNDDSPMSDAAETALLGAMIQGVARFGHTAL